MSDAKDSLIDLGKSQADPYHATGSDFPVSSGAAAGSSQGHNQLIEDSTNQCGPRYIEDSGPGESGAGTPTDWQSGGRAGHVSSNFKVSQSSAEQGTGSAFSLSVNLQDGTIDSKSYKATKVKEVADPNVHIG